MGELGGRYVRHVGGSLTSSHITKTSAMRIELLRRKTAGRMHWHFRQPELALFWFKRGAVRLNATIDGRPVRHDFVGSSQLALFPGGVEIQGEWDVGPDLEYTVVFLDPEFVGKRFQTPLNEPAVAFSHDSILHGVAELSREARAPDDLFELMSEGWAMQALAHISRIRQDVVHRGVSGGLSGKALRDIDDFVWANLSQPISIKGLAAVAGLSERQFLRVFRGSLGKTPYGFVLERRIEDAKRRLAQTADSITQVALDTGFSHAQHFSTSFRRSTGINPSQFRRRSLS